MDSSLVKSVPQGDFAEISALVKGWEIKFQSLASQKRPIKFDVYPLSKIPSDIDKLLNQQGYQDLILDKDRWQHFLVPISNESGPDRARDTSVLKRVGEPSLVASRLFDLK
jgi:hypothetical protein